MISETMDNTATVPPPAPERTSSAAPTSRSAAGDYAEHVRFYRGVVKGIAIFVAHAFIILALMAYFLT